MIGYSPSTRGFYLPENSSAPTDLVLIDAAYHAELMQGQSLGRSIVPGVDGVPVLTAPPGPPTIAERRAGCFVSRIAFCTALFAQGLLSGSEAIAAAKGEWPEVFTTAIASLPSADQTLAQIAWAGATQIERLHPFILAIQPAIGLTDEQVDALFGLTA